MRRHSLAPRLIIAAALMGFLFTLDAALGSGVTPSAVLGMIALAVLLGWVLIRLAHTVMHGSPQRRHAAIAALNAIGALPPIVVLGLSQSIDPQYRSQVVSATVVWLVVVLFWTTVLLENVAHRTQQRPEADPQPKYGGRLASTTVH